MVSEQWFVDVKEAADKSMEAIETKTVNVVPSRFNKTFFQWLSNIQPWCISRQLWW
jgi:valyl-tRNA synthetase